MSPVSPVFHTEVTVSIGLKTSFRVVTYSQINVSTSFRVLQAPESWSKYTTFGGAAPKCWSKYTTINIFVIVWPRMEVAQ